MVCWLVKRHLTPFSADLLFSGPADPGGSAPAPELSPIIKPWKVFRPIRVRRDCDDDDPEAYLSKYSWYQVKVS